jgi:hypothetical protein
MYKFSPPIISLKFLSKSHNESVCTYSISFSFVMFCDSDIGLLNSFNSVCLISAKFLAFPICLVLFISMYHTNAWPLNVFSDYAIFAPSSSTFFAAQIVLQTNKICFEFYDPSPWKLGTLRVFLPITCCFVYSLFLVMLVDSHSDSLHYFHYSNYFYSILPS